jgi:TRAP-type C4-dicarboxylate transport system substrate-binding protein
MASAVFSVVMNEGKFNSLSPEHRQLILETTGPARAKAFGAMWDEGEAKGRDYILSKGVEIVLLEGAELEKLTSLVEPITETTIQAVEDDGKPGRAFFDAYTK